MADVIELDDPRRPDVTALLIAHLAFAKSNSPPEDVHALDVDRLCVPEITFISLRREGVLLGLGALREMDSYQGEIKSMHTAATARKQGVGRKIVEHLLDLARSRGYGRVQLETGSMTSFVPAHRLYESMGFLPCGPFGDYVPSRNSRFYSLVLSKPKTPGIRLAKNGLSL